MTACRLAVLAAALLATGALRAEPPAVEDIRRAVDGNVESAIALYREFLSLPNDALKQDDIERLVAWLEKALVERIAMLMAVLSRPPPYRSGCAELQ